VGGETCLIGVLYGAIWFKGAGGMESGELQKSRLTRADLLGLALIVPIAAIVLVAIFLSASSIEQLVWGTSVSWIDKALVVSFSIGSGIFAGSCAAPTRFAKPTACIISAIFLLCMMGVWLTYRNWTYIWLAGAFIGVYFALPSILAITPKDGDKKLDPPHLNFIKYSIIAIIIIATAIPFIIIAALSHYFHDVFPLLMVFMILCNAIGTAWRWVVNRKIAGISPLFSLFGRLWKYLPFGILFSLAIGGIAAASGHAALSPYAAMGGFFAFVVVVLFVFAKSLTQSSPGEPNIFNATKFASDRSTKK
jgi:hypothetical protein